MSAPLTLPARYYARFAEMLAELGVDSGRLLQRAGIDAALLGDPEGQLPQPAVERFIELALEVTGRTDLPLDYGRRLKLSAHSIVGYAMLSSPSMDYAYRVVARYFRIIMPTFRLQYRRSGEKAEVLLQAAAPMGRVFLNFHIEAIAAAWHWESQELIRHALAPYQLQLSISEPPHSARYTELQEARVVFGWPMAPGFRLVLPAAIVDQPVPLADPATLRFAEARCKALVDRVRARGSLAGWVAMMLRESHESLPTATELARLLNLSRQTLHRTLRAEGVSYRALANTAQFHRACALLRQGDLSVAQIALMLGYTDSSNFARAFTRQSGHSPTAWLQRERERDKMTAD